MQVKKTRSELALDAFVDFLKTTVRCAIAGGLWVLWRNELSDDFPAVAAVTFWHFFIGAYIVNAAIDQSPSGATK
jgi:hypothetical protein